MVGLDPADDDGAARARARALAQEIRSGDVLYRYGPGDVRRAAARAGRWTPRTWPPTGCGARSSTRRRPGTAVSVGIVTTGRRARAGGAARRAAEAALAALGARPAAIDGQGAGGRRRAAAAGRRRRPGVAADARRDRQARAGLRARRRGRGRDVRRSSSRCGGGRTSCCSTSTCPAAAARGPRSRSARGCPTARIVAISADDSQGSQYDMMRAGAVGFVTKGSSDDEILRVIRSLSPLVTRRSDDRGGRGIPPYSTRRTAGSRP